MENAVLSRREALRTRRRRPSTLTIPDRVSPHVKLVFVEMRRQGQRYEDVVEKSGVQRAALKTWRHRSKPSFESLEAVLGALGWDLVPVPRAKVLDPALVAALGPVAERFQFSMPQTLEVLVALVARIHERAGDAPSTAASIEEMKSA